MQHSFKCVPLRSATETEILPEGVVPHRPPVTDHGDRCAPLDTIGRSVCPSVRLSVSHGRLSVERATSDWSALVPVGRSGRLMATIAVNRRFTAGRRRQPIFTIVKTNCVTARPATSHRHTRRFVIKRVRTRTSRM